MTFIDEQFNYQFVLKPEYEPKVITAKERCLRTGRWKLVCTPLADGGRSFRLFFLPEDPHCQSNLAADRPEVLDVMRRALERWMDERKETPHGEIFPAGEP